MNTNELNYDHRGSWSKRIRLKKGINEQHFENELHSDHD